MSEIKRSKRIHLITEPESEKNRTVEVIDYETRPLDFTNESAPVDSLTWEKFEEKFSINYPPRVEILIKEQAEKAVIWSEAYKAGLINREDFKKQFTDVSTITGRTSSRKPNIQEIPKTWREQAKEDIWKEMNRAASLKNKEAIIAAQVELSMAKRLQKIQSQKKGAKK